MMITDDYGTLESPSRLDWGWILSCNMMFQLKERNKTIRGREELRRSAEIEALLVGGVHNWGVLMYNYDINKSETPTLTTANDPQHRIINPWFVF